MLYSAPMQTILGIVAIREFSEGDTKSACGTAETLPATVDLTDDQIRVLAILAGGATVDATARSLGISARTLRRRCRDICDQGGVQTLVEAVVWAARRGLV